MSGRQGLGLTRLAGGGHRDPLFQPADLGGQFAVGGAPLTKSSMPPLNSIVRTAAAERRIRTGPSTSDNTEIVCRFGRNRRFVLTLEWLTLWPTWTPLPVTGHLRAIS